MGALVLVLAFVPVMALSYGITAGLLWLVCLCLGWPWSWQTALGVWIALVVLKAVFGRSDK